MVVDVLARRRVPGVPAAALVTFARRLVRLAPAGEADGLTIVLAGDALLKSLNHRYRAKDATTDVLSFPSDGRPLPDGTRPLGEIVISVAQAARQARRAGHTLSREIRVLVIHGYLHLLGYDHEVDDGTMMRLQRRLTRRLLAASRG